MPNASRPAKSTSPRFDTYIHRNQRVRVPHGYLAVGMIAGAHGLRGEMKMELHTDFPDRFTPGAQVYTGVSLAAHTIISARPHQQQLLIQLEGIHDRTAAEELRGAWLFVPEDDAAELDEDTYFVHDIIGLAVQTTAGVPLGTVEEVLFTGANEVYVVVPPGQPRREILLPAIAQVIRTVDLDNGLLIVELLPGLIDDADINHTGTDLADTDLASTDLTGTDSGDSPATPTSAPHTP
jgi:16S rRNA processing protein RimM